MNEDFIPFELAKKLKEKGFKQDCVAYYMPHSDELIYNIKPYKGVELYSFNSLRKELISSDFIDAPTITQVLKWLREEKEWNIEIYPVGFGDWNFNCTHITTLEDRGLLGNWDSYESSILAGIEYVLDNLI